MPEALVYEVEKVLHPLLTGMEGTSLCVPKSKSEADQAVAIARGVDGVKSVKNDIQVTSAVSSR